jgi:hypothetical protein
MRQFGRAAATVVSAILSCSAVAHAQSFGPGSIAIADADPPLDEEPADTSPPTPPPTASPSMPHCTCTPTMCVPGCDLPPLVNPEVGEDELEAVLIGGASAAALGYLVSNVLVAMQPHRTAVVDGIPVFGAIWSVAHNDAGDRTTPLLLFSAGVQAIGILVTVAAATELHDLRRLNLDISASATGGSMSVGWRF